MSISTEQHAATVQRMRMPEMLFPQVGKDAKEEREDILSSYPDFVEDGRRRIRAVDRDAYLYWTAMADYAKEQKALASNVIRRLLGDAEYGFTGRLVFVQRRAYPVEGHYVKPARVDALYKVKN